MGDGPRRRRYEPGDGGKRPSRGIPWFPLAVIVIFAGFLIGGIAGRLFGTGGAQSGSGLPPGAPHVQPLPSSGGQAPDNLDSPTPMPTESPVGSPSPQASPTPTTTPVSTPTPKAAATPSIAPSKTSPPAASATPSHKATASPAPAPSATAVPVTPAPQHAATPAAQHASNPSGTTASGSGASAAESAVRAYLNALARGDNSTATSYLASGLPTETFMGPSAQIISIQASASSEHPGVYKVGADVKASSGEYFTTFMVQPAVTGGYQIYDHYSIKP